MKAILLQIQFSFKQRKPPPESNIHQSPLQHSRNRYSLRIRGLKSRNFGPNVGSEIHRLALRDHRTLGRILDDHAGQCHTAETIVVGFKSDLVIGHQGRDIDSREVELGPSNEVPGEEKSSGRVPARVARHQRMRLNGTAKTF